MKKILFTIFIIVSVNISFAQTEKKLMTPEILWSFGRISDVSVSPDNSLVLFSARYYNIQNNKGQTDFYSVPSCCGKTTRITNSSDAKYSPQWRPDGKKIGFICAKSGSAQLWEMNPDGSDWKQISNIEGGINDWIAQKTFEKIKSTKSIKPYS